MKGNTKETDYEGWAAFCIRYLPMRPGENYTVPVVADVRKIDKHHRRSVTKVLRTGGVCRGKSYKKMLSLGWESEPSKTFSQATRLAANLLADRQRG